MKVSPEPHLIETEASESGVISLPQGLIGLPGYTQGELLALPDNPPFLLLKLTGPLGTLNFVVVEPGGLVSDYEPELFDADAASIDIQDPADALVLNVVTLCPTSPLEATMNLIGPIVINRRTRAGRQVVIANNSRYSARHFLIEDAASRRD